MISAVAIIYLTVVVSFLFNPVLREMDAKPVRSINRNDGRPEHSPG